MHDVTIRSATADDVDRITEIMHGDPGPEAVALLGSRERARRFGAMLVRLDHLPNPAKPTVVAVRAEGIAGVLQYTHGTGESPITPAHVTGAFRALGPLGVLRGIPRLRARSKVDLPVPPASFYVAEVHVDPTCRGEGIGGRLLDWAAEEAARLGATRMTLTTTTANPARHLYERKGFTVVATATDPRYERYTGITGRVLMEKHLDS